MKGIWRFLIIVGVTVFAFAIDAGVPFGLFVLLVYFEFIREKRKQFI